MKETVEDMMKRIAAENDFDGEEYSTYIGVAPEITLTYLYGTWVADLYCEGQLCYFAGDNADEVYDIVKSETNWHGDDFPGETAQEALQQMDVVCKKFRQHNFILTAAVERD